ncbi:hypothetical protein BH11PSE11_BH11PSE11_09090 [soil metagenome]
MRHSSTTSLSHTCRILALILSLLFAQFSGLQHRIDHARWASDDGISTFDAQTIAESGSRLVSDNSWKSASHSCVAFDAAALADTFDATPCVLVLALNADAVPRQLSGASWDAPVTHHFLSRAPPALIS